MGNGPRGGNTSLFDADGFLREHADPMARPFLALLFTTQMFDRFCEDRVYNPQLSEVLFFDQSIHQKVRDLPSPSPIA